MSSAGIVTELQKENIRVAILQAIVNSPYYEGLELEDCNAISNINKYSDKQSILEMVDIESGDRYVKED